MNINELKCSTYQSQHSIAFIDLHIPIPQQWSQAKCAGEQVPNKSDASSPSATIDGVGDELFKTTGREGCATSAGEK
jgi:hypothetical protein